MPTNTSFQTPILLIGNDPGSSAATEAVGAMAQKLASFIGEAKKSLHVAIYDFQLQDAAAAQLVVGAFKKAASDGKEILIAYDHTKSGSKKAKGGGEDDPALRGTLGFVTQNLPDSGRLRTKPIAGDHLMHDKYIIRDGGTPDAAVWMGSANFTDGAWSLQENNVLIIQSKELAARYEEDFQDLWQSGNIKKTGVNDYGELQVGGDSVEFAFAPGEGSAAASLFVDAIQGAEGETIMLSTMVLSSGPILGALIDHLAKKGRIVGVYDATQMKGVVNDWRKSSSPKATQWRQIQPLLIGKPSTPFSAKSDHDFMHNKVLVTDHVVVTGSFNLSQNAESNAENAISIHDKSLAKAYQDYVQSLVKFGKKNWQPRTGRGSK